MPSDRIVYMLARPLPEVYASEEDYQISPRLRKRVIPYIKGKHKEINVITLVI